MLSQTVPAHRFTVEDVLAMVAAGILDERDRVELVEGVLVEMNPSGPRHSGVVEWLTEHFVTAARGACRVRVQDTFLTPDGGFVQPDLIVLEPIGRDRLPDTALLVIEVAYSSRARDAEKAAAYAAAGVPEYWIVDVDRDELVVHRLPDADAYETVERFASGDVVGPLVGVPPVEVAALLAR